MTEAAVVRAVPDAARGRVVGGFITVGGLLGNLGHWWAGERIARLGTAASRAEAYQPFFLMLAAMIVAALLALPWLLRLNHPPKSAGATVTNSTSVDLGDETDTRNPRGLQTLMPDESA